MTVTTSSNNNKPIGECIFSLKREVAVPTLTFLTPSEQCFLALTNKEIFRFFNEVITKHNTQNYDPVVFYRSIFPPKFADNTDFLRDFRNHLKYTPISELVNCCRFLRNISINIEDETGKIDFIFRKTNQPCTFINSLQNRHELTATLLEKTKERLIQNIHQSRFSESFNAIMTSTDNDPCIVTVVQIVQANFFFHPLFSGSIQEGEQRIQKVGAHISPYLSRLNHDEVRSILDIATSYEVLGQGYPPVDLALLHRKLEPILRRAFNLPY